MHEQHSQRSKPNGSQDACLAVISVERDAIIHIDRDGGLPAQIIARSTGLKPADLKTGTVYEAADNFDGWIAIRLDPVIADICDYLIADVVGGAVSAVQVAKRFGMARTYIRPTVPQGGLPDFLHDRTDDHGDEDEE